MYTKPSRFRGIPRQYNIRGLPRYVGTNFDKMIGLGDSTAVDVAKSVGVAAATTAAGQYIPGAGGISTLVQSWVQGKQVDVHAVTDQLVKGLMSAVNPVAGIFNAPGLIIGLTTSIASIFGKKEGPPQYIADFRLGPFYGALAYHSFSPSDVKRFNIPMYPFEEFTQGAAIGTILGLKSNMFAQAFGSGLSPHYFQPFIVPISSGQSTLPREWIPLINACVAEYAEMTHKRNFYITSGPGPGSGYSIGEALDFVTKQGDSLGHAGGIFGPLPPSFVGTPLLGFGPQTVALRAYIASQPPRAPMSFLRWINEQIYDGQHPTTFVDLVIKYNLQDWVYSMIPKTEPVITVPTFTPITKPVIQNGGSVMTKPSISSTRPPNKQPGRQPLPASLPSIVEPTVGVPPSTTTSTVVPVAKPNLLVAGVTGAGIGIVVGGPVGAVVGGLIGLGLASIKR